MAWNTSRIAPTALGAADKIALTPSERAAMVPAPSWISSNGSEELFSMTTTVLPRTASPLSKTTG
ncbi:MAG TPA: hypothetical protein DEG88_10980, partial [Propionibacteriaceae bacterium]|nr:hypothetical protein [Propionibacteriaceae bacterium]